MLAFRVQIGQQLSVTNKKNGLFSAQFCQKLWTRILYFVIHRFFRRVQFLDAGGVENIKLLGYEMSMPRNCLCATPKHSAKNGIVYFLEPGALNSSFPDNDTATKGRYNKISRYYLFLRKPSYSLNMHFQQNGAPGSYTIFIRD